MKRHVFLSCFLMPVALLATMVYASDGWNIQTVDNSGDTGYYSSLAYDSQGYPHIVYYNSSTGSLMYTRWTGGGWQCETIAQGAYYWKYGQYCSIAIDDEDKPHIAYYSVQTHRGSAWGPVGDLTYAFKDNNGWHATGGFHEIFRCCYHDVYYGLYTSIAVARDPNTGLIVPHIAYYAQSGGDLWHAWRTTGWNKEIVDGAGDVGQYTSIALDDQLNVYISYYDAGAQDLKFAYYDGSQWGTQIIDGTDALGKFTSLVLDDLGIVHITYYDETYGHLKHVSLTLQ